MATKSIITNERVDDIPLLLTQIERMGIKKLIDKHFPTHGNWHCCALYSAIIFELLSTDSSNIFVAKTKRPALLFKDSITLFTSDKVA